MLDLRLVRSSKRTLPWPLNTSKSRPWLHSLLSSSRDQDLPGGGDSLPKMLRAHFEQTRDKAVPGSHAEAFLRDIPKNDLKEQTTTHVLKAPSIYADHFLTKDWVLVATSTEYPFLLGDNPLTRQNSNDQGHRGNLGLTSPGVEIYLPLSSTRALALLCPTLTNAVHRCARSVRNELKGDVNDPEGFVAMSNTLSSGRPLQYSAANVENLNSLQIVWSERYIFPRPMTSTSHEQ